MTEPEKKEIVDMIAKALGKFEREHRMSKSSMIVDTPTDINAVVNIQFLVDEGLIVYP